MIKCLFCLSYMSNPQSNQIVDERKFLFMEVFLLINEDRMLATSCRKYTTHLRNILYKQKIKP